MNRELTIATLNLENGKRLDLLPDLVAQVPRVDLLMLKEGKGWDAEGQRRRFQAEGILGAMGLDRSFMDGQQAAHVGGEGVMGVALACPVVPGEQEVRVEGAGQRG
jgi:hypothetical protein